MKFYKLPSGNVQICFSGGRTSAFMLHQILEANGGLPDRVVVSFQNTGREMPQTLDFVQECSERWGVNVVWTEYRAQQPMFEVVSHNSASRNGEPFEALIRKRQLLPNPRSRFCTIELKIRTGKRYLRSIGWDYWTNITGIRADEPKRVQPEGVKLRDRWTVYQPLVHAGVSKHDVALFWRKQPFDLRLPNIRGVTALGNCDGCFLKAENKIAALARYYPERHQWWEDMEYMASDWTLGNGARFRKEYSRRSIRDFVERQGDWIFDDEDALCQVDGGECI